MAIDESDHLLELNDIFTDEDEPLFPLAPKPGGSTVAAGSATTARAPVSSPAGPPANVPPPLPSKRPNVAQSPASTALPPAPQATPGLKPASSPPTPMRGLKSAPGSPAPPSSGVSAKLPAPLTLPQQVPRPGGGDPFLEPPEPRVPPGADSDEKLKIFRSIVKTKDEALGRGRTLFAAVDQEAQQLRIAAMTLRSQLDAASAELQHSAGYSQQLAHLRELLEKDTIRADEAEKKIEQVIARLAEADAERKDLSNALAEVETQHAAAVGELERERTQRGQLGEELAGAKEALNLAQDRVGELAGQMAEAHRYLDRLKSEGGHETARLSTEVQRLEAELVQVRGARAEAEQRLEGTAARLAEQSARIETVEAQLGESHDQTRAQLQGYQERFEAKANEAEELRVALAVAQQQLGAHSDLETRFASAEAQVDELRNLAHQQQRALAERDAKLDQLQATISYAEAHVVEARDSAREAQQTVAEAEGRADEAMAKSLALTTQVHHLQESMAVLQTTLTQAEVRATAQKSGATEKPAAELEGLRSEIATLKKKLAHAESAVEAAASLRLKVNRLEAQLKAVSK
jgi:chromosome segregation ATPase